MKTLTNVRKFSGFVAVLALLLVSATAFAADKKDPTVENHLQKIVDGYLHIQDALANDTVEHVNHRAMAIEKNAESAIELAKKDEKKNEKLLETLGHVAISAKALTGDDLKIKEAREKFYALSDVVIELVKNYLPEKSAKTYNVLYCPMAKGYWIQTDEKTRNPYYGEEMLTCGKVIDYAKECAKCEGKCGCDKKKGKCGCQFKGSEKGKKAHSEHDH